MNDYISRQAALHYIADWQYGEANVGNETVYDNIEKCYKMIEQLPSAQPQRWIQCSEETGDGYPEEDGFYYVTEQNYGFYLDADYKQRVAHTSHFKNGDFTDRFYAENSSNITAWMPLPDPYRGKQDETRGVSETP